MDHDESAAVGPRPLAVRVELPFCPNTCQYCPMPSDIEHALLMGDYCEALRVELAQSAADLGDYRVSSLYLGGGAASFVKVERVCALLGLAREKLAFEPDAEVTLRCLPGYINELKVRDYLRAGVTAVDLDWHMGSLDCFRFTGRASLPEQERASLRAFAHYGLHNVGFELRYGAPGQTLAQWRGVLDEVLGFSPMHVSAVPFEVPEGSMLHRELANLHIAYGDRVEFRLAAGDALREMRELAVERLGAAGMREYLPGQFVLEGFERRHLLDAHRGIDVLDLGAGGSSRIDGFCSANVGDIAAYVRTGGEVARVVEKAWLA